jgi:repressor LexA
MDNLTPKQRKVLDFISDRIEANGIPPTIREIGAHLSVYPRAVQDHLAALERKGVLRRIKDQARGIIVAGQRAVENMVSLPVLGSVPAGMPVEAIPQTDDFFAVDEAIAKQANFALRVKGDSMYPTLWNGDLVLVQFTPTADNGEIVVASVQGDDATVKKLRKTPKEVYLQAVNPAYPDIRGDITIVGRVTSMIRPTFHA